MNPIIDTGAIEVKWFRRNKGAAHCDVTFSVIYLTGNDRKQRSANSCKQYIVNFLLQNIEVYRVV